MSIRKNIIGLSIYLAIALLAGQALSRTQEHDSTTEAETKSDWIEQTLAEEQRTKKQLLQQQMQMEKEREQFKKQMQSESIKRTDEITRQQLRATNRQWKNIKPRLERIQNLLSQVKTKIEPLSYRKSRRYFVSPNKPESDESSANGNNRDERKDALNPNLRQPVTRIEEGWKWSRPSEHKARNELTEGERVCEELLELLEDKNSKPDQIDQKIEALQKARQEANKKLVKEQQELRDELTIRQEAMLVLMGILD